MSRFSFAFLLGLPVFLSSCGLVKDYNASGIQNLTVNTRLDSVKATMDLYEMDQQCHPMRLGRVNLTNGLSQYAIPAQRRIYVVVSFNSFSFIGGSSQVSADALINTRPHAIYELDVSYVENIYRVVPYERDRKNGTRHELADSCDVD